MARMTTLTDDLDGKPDAIERRFNVAGIEYAIDLTDENYAKFLDAVQPYRSVARVAKGSRSNNTRKLTEEDRAAIREWAQENGRHLAARGRYPKALVEDYFSEQDARLVIQV